MVCNMTLVLNDHLMNEVNDNSLKTGRTVMLSCTDECFHFFLNCGHSKAIVDSWELTRCIPLLLCNENVLELHRGSGCTMW